MINNANQSSRAVITASFKLQTLFVLIFTRLTKPVELKIKSDPRKKSMSRLH